MAFTRIKTVKGKRYAYLVENKWVEGKVRQKVLEYLGPVSDEETCEVTVNGSSYHGILQLLLSEHAKKVTVNVKKQTLSKAFSANNGVLNAQTLKALCDYEHGNKGKPGSTLALLFSKAGVNVAPETFIKLYKARMNECSPSKS